MAEVSTISSHLRVEQGTPEWLEARLGIATASRFGDIMTTIKSGESSARKNYRAELTAERLTGVRTEGFKSAAMEWGSEYEPVARTAYELKTGLVTQTAGIFLHNKLRAGASPDALIGEDGLLEIKCPNTATHLETLLTKKVPKLYYWQVMGQLWITGRNWCDFVSYDPRMPVNARMFVKRIFLDEDAIEDLEYSVEDFLTSVDEQVNFVKNYKENEDE